MSQIFISYSRTHPLYAERIEEDLLQEQRYSVWLDRKDILGGEDWRHSIQSAIEKSVVVLIIITQEAVDSEYVREEIRIAQNLNKICIPLIMERFKSPEMVESTVSTLELDTYKQHINFEQTGYKEAYLKLLRTLQQAMDDWSYLEGIIGKFNHFNPTVRVNAATKLGETKDYRVVNALIEAISVENNLAVLEAICKAFSNYLEDERVVSILSRYVATNFHSPFPSMPAPFDPLRKQAAQSLGLLEVNSEKAFEQFIKEVSFWEFKDQLEVATLLFKDYEKALQEFGFMMLVAFLDHGNLDISIGAITSLGNAPNEKRSVEYLIPLLTHENESIKSRTRSALKNLAYNLPDEDKTT